MRSVSGRCGGWIPSGYTSGQAADIIFDMGAKCPHKFIKKDMRKKVCKECVKLHEFCKLLRSITPATQEPGKLGSCSS